jgi:biopolymer transport protein ExbD
METEVDVVPASRRRHRRARRRRNGAEELNIVSMIDVFAVLVFFLLVSSSIAAARLNVLALSLPSRHAAASPERLLTVTVLQDGLVLTDRGGVTRRLPKRGDDYDVATLSDWLVRAKKAAPRDDRLVLLVDPKISYGPVVKVMDAARVTPAKARLIGLPPEMFPRISIGAPS